MSTTLRPNERAEPGRHLSVEEMNDLVDGLLPSDREGLARDHLAGCRRCRDEVRMLGDAVEALGGLPDEARVPDGVWEGVARRLASHGGDRTNTGPDGNGGVLPFPGPSRDLAPVGARRAFGPRHLAAAAVLAAVLSGGAVWLALGPGSGGAGTGVVTTEPSVPVAASPARMASTGGQVAYDLAVRELEILVREGDDLLAPETRAALEASLATIDEALADVRQALEEDPSSELLMSLLVNHQTARIRVLRQAAARIQVSS